MKCLCSELPLPLHQKLSNPGQEKEAGCPGPSGAGAASTRDVCVDFLSLNRNREGPGMLMEFGLTENKLVLK